MHVMLRFSRPRATSWNTLRDSSCEFGTVLMMSTTTWSNEAFCRANHFAVTIAQPRIAHVHLHPSVSIFARQSWHRTPSLDSCAKHGRHRLYYSTAINDVHYGTYPSGSAHLMSYHQKRDSGSQRHCYPANSPIHEHNHFRQFSGKYPPSCTA